MAVSKKATTVPAVETTATELTAHNNKAVAHLENKRRELVEAYKRERKVAVKGAPAYQPHFGAVMSLNINGILVAVPLDGTRYEIPETFASLFNTRIRAVDVQGYREKAMTAARANLEQYPGERDLINPV